MNKQADLDSRIIHTLTYITVRYNHSLGVNDVTSCLNVSVLVLNVLRPA